MQFSLFSTGYYSDDVSRFSDFTKEPGNQISLFASTLGENRIAG